jgi:hypothetical protein
MTVTLLNGAHVLRLPSPTRSRPMKPDSLEAGWQPIETAPRDEPLILFSPDAREPKVCIGSLVRWHDGSEDWADWWSDHLIDAEPSFWMPLPPPPARQQGVDRG